MKRYRHYNKETAIILSCFGSVIEQDKYLEFERYIQKSFSDKAVFSAFSSRMVLKLLAKENKHYKNLPQVLADVDLEGYRRIVVASINIYPTDEHELLIRTIKGFRRFSLAQIRYTAPLIQKTKESSLYLKWLDESLRRGDEELINLYVIHGAPILDLAGLEAISYTKDFLELLNPHNLICSLEGEFPFYATKDSIKRKILQLSGKSARVQVIPLLLVSGNHYDKDIKEICDEVASYAKVSIAASLTKDEKFNLIEQEQVRRIFCDNIAVEIKKMGIE